METALYIYLYLTLLNITEGAIGIILFLIVAHFFVRVVFEEEGKCYFKHLGICLLVAAFVSGLLPSKSDLTYIVGGASLWSVAQTEEAQKLPSNVLKALNTVLESVQEETK